MKTDFPDGTTCTTYSLTLTDRQAEVLLSLLSPADEPIVSFGSVDVDEVYAAVCNALSRGGFCGSHVAKEWI